MKLSEAPSGQHNCAGARVKQAVCPGVGQVNFQFSRLPLGSEIAAVQPLHGASSKLNHKLHGRFPCLPLPSEPEEYKLEQHGKATVRVAPGARRPSGNHALQVLSLANPHLVFAPNILMKRLCALMC